MEGEEWRPVPSLRSRYEVSDLGNVRHAVTKRVRKPQKGKYRIFVHKEGGKLKSRYVHNLVAECFLGPCPDGHEINHKNGDKQDAALTNLEYLTKSGNMEHAYGTGLIKHKRGADWWASKLTAEKVADARRRHKDGEKQKDLAKEMGVSVATMSEAISGKRWAINEKEQV